ncbi:MAG: hypothetical protein KGI38_11765 [Thaumarchaeota archaeon]|nr:hypothetical protein [Nitrososphaerota archaeon]
MALETVRAVPMRPINWLQGRRAEFVDWSLPWAFYNVGDVDQGKMGADIAEATNYLAESPYYRVRDLFGSDNDSESLTWFKSPYKDETAAIVDDSWAGEMPFPTIRVSDFSIAKANQYRVVVTDRMLFRNEAVHYSSLGRIFQMFRDRRGYKQETGKPIIALIVREARKVIMAQLRANMTKDQQEAEYVFADMNAQRAHSGIAPIVDNQRWKGVHVDYRDLASYKVLKGFGPQVIPDELDWVFKPEFAMKWLSTPFRTRQTWPSFLRNMPVRQFVCLDRWNGVCHGVIGEIEWLKYKGYDLAELLQIRPAFDKPIEPEPKQGALTPHAKEMLEMHRRIRELEAKGLNAKEITAQVELEGRKRRSVPGIFYHMTAGSCTCESKLLKGE